MDDPLPLSRTEALLEQVRRNEVGAADELLEHVLPDIVRSVADELGAGVKASFESVDCVQDVALGLVRYLPRVRARDGRTLRALIRRMVRNTLCNKAAWLMAKRDQIISASPFKDGTMISLDPLDERAATPSEIAIESEHRAWVHLGIALLDPDDQELVVRREFDEESYETIGTTLGISTDAARMRTRRAREDLARMLERLQRGEAAEMFGREGRADE